MNVFGDPTEGEGPVFAGRAEEQLAVQEAQVDAREREVKAEAERLRRQNESLRLWEGELETGEQRIELVSKPASRPRTAKASVGRNERCPCGSGSRYKRCHG